MTAGRGWIALALVVFAAWRPLRVLIGAYLFGGVTILQLHAQGGALIDIPSQFLSMLPYIATIIVLTLMSSWGGTRKRLAGASLPRQAIPPYSLGAASQAWQASIACLLGHERTSQEPREFR